MGNLHQANMFSSTSFPFLLLANQIARLFHQHYIQKQEVDLFAIFACGCSLQKN